MLRDWMVFEVAESAYRHGAAYAEGRIMRSASKFRYKCPDSALPDWVLQFDLNTHKWLADVYRHAFRAGLKQGVPNA